METIKEEKKAELKERIKDIECRMGMMSNEYFDYAIKEIEALQRKIEQIDKKREEEIKEEYNNKLEQLLNSLIEKGWKPYGMEQYDRFIIESAGDMCFRWKYPGADGESAFDYNYDYFKIRELVSIDSGLWQFVCENGMIKEGHKHERILDPTFGEGWADCKRQEHDGNYGYRLIEASLKDESELEDFLLQNIKVDVESK